MESLLYVTGDLELYFTFHYVLLVPRSPLHLFSGKDSLLLVFSVPQVKCVIFPCVHNLFRCVRIQFGISVSDLLFNTVCLAVYIGV